MNPKYLLVSILFLFFGICHAEEYAGVCYLISQDDKTATFESAGMSVKSTGVEENAIKSLFHSLFYIGIEDVNNSQPLVQKENKTYS